MPHDCAGDRVDELRRGSGAGEIDIQQVVGVLPANRALAVARGGHVGGAFDQPVGEQHAVRELNVVAGCTEELRDLFAAGANL